MKLERECGYTRHRSGGHARGPVGLDPGLHPAASRFPVGLDPGLYPACS